MSDIDVLLVEPGQHPRMTTIGSNLESLQQAVGGYIESVYPFDDEVAIICNDEGKINGDPLNRALRDDNGEVVDIIAGTFFVCGIGEDDFISLPNDLQEKYEEIFHNPEVFLKLGNRIVAIPTDPVELSPSRDTPSKGIEL